MAMIFIY